MANHTICLWHLARVFMAVIVAPGDEGATTREMEASYLRRFGQRAVYANDYVTEAGLGEKCWDDACAAEASGHPCRFEAALLCAFRRGKRNVMHGDVVPRWFVFTDRGTWWHDEGLYRELARAEAMLRPATPDEDILLIGGGGLLPFTNFLILSRPALVKLVRGKFLADCKERLGRCDPAIRGSGCRFKARVGAGYTGGQLARYCLADDLGRCARPGGCSWIFGSPGESGRDAAASRARFVANDGRRAVAAVLGALGEMSNCDVADRMEQLVAFGNADDFEHLADLRDAARECATDAGEPYACKMRIPERIPREFVRKKKARVADEEEDPTTLAPTTEADHADAKGAAEERRAADRERAAEELEALRSRLARRDADSPRDSDARWIRDRADAAEGDL